MKLRIGGDLEYLKIEAQRYTYSSEEEDSWITCALELSSNSIQSKVSNATFLSDDFVFLKDELVKLSRGKIKKFEFEATDGYLDLKFNLATLGGLEVSGTLWPTPKLGSRVQFVFELDQTFISKMVSELEAVTTAFPVRIGSGK